MAENSQEINNEKIVTWFRSWMIHTNQAVRGKIYSQPVCYNDSHRRALGQ